jgi:hypothetical protein
MQSLTMLLAGLSGLALTNAAPLTAREACGVAPSGPTGAAPLAQPSGITTPAACEAACKADTSCEAFVCGYVTSAPVCILYAVPASSIPPQSNSNLLAYDLACTSVPTGTLSASDPTGANTGAGTGANTGANAGASTQSGAALINASPLVTRDVCGSAPSGPTGATPLAQPSGITTPAACEAACKADTSCEAFVCGYVTSAPVCILYAVPASSIPPQSNSNLLAYDLACTSVPTGTLTAANPTGANDPIVATVPTGATIPTGAVVPTGVNNPAGSAAGSGRMA